MKPVALLALAVSIAQAQELGAAPACSPLHLVFARATGEPPQNGSTPQPFDTAAAEYWSKGFGASGFSLYSNISKLIPGATAWSVHYPAVGANMPASIQKGSAEMIAQITAMSKACPKQKYVVGGHSQGGFVTVDAIPKMPRDILSKVIAVTMFGAPPCPAVVRDRCNSYCYKGDFVCDAGGAAGGGGGAPKTGGAAKGGPPNAPGGVASPKGVQQMERKTNRDELQDRCANTPAIRGLSPKGSGNSHLLYSSDGVYVYAAACYVAQRWKATGGT